MGKGTQSATFVINSSLKHAGLFGHSYEAVIRNATLDTSFSAASSYSVDNPYLGNTKIGPCAIENTVNIGSVTFTGSTNTNTSSYFMLFGGIACAFFPTPGDHGTTTKNCVN